MIEIHNSIIPDLSLSQERHPLLYDISYNIMNYLTLMKRYPRYIILGVDTYNKYIIEKTMLSDDEYNKYFGKIKVLCDHTENGNLLDLAS